MKMVLTRIFVDDRASELSDANQRQDPTSTLLTRTAPILVKGAQRVAAEDDRHASTVYVLSVLIRGGDAVDRHRARRSMVAGRYGSRRLVRLGPFGGDPSRASSEGAPFASASASAAGDSSVLSKKSRRCSKNSTLRALAPSAPDSTPSESSGASARELRDVERLALGAVEKPQVALQAERDGALADQRETEKHEDVALADVPGERGDGEGLRGRAERNEGEVRASREGGASDGWEGRDESDRSIDRSIGRGVGAEVQGGRTNRWSGWG